MRISHLFTLHSVLFATVNGGPADDMESLSESCENAAAALNTSLNNTMPMNTSSLIQNVMWQVGASTSNLEMNSSTSSNSTSSRLDEIYFDYIDSMRTLSEAVIRRGRIFHQEMNRPVYDALKGLATAVQAYGMQLSNAGMISQNATIRTFSAGSSLVDAEGVWANNANYPGPRRRAVRLSA